MAEFDRESLKRTFDHDAELYDKARPDYPEEIFDDLFEICGLDRNAKILEIGWGSGPATGPLAARVPRRLHQTIIC